MRDGIAIIMAVLGALLVLSGAAALWASAFAQVRAGGTDPAAPPQNRAVTVASRLPAPDRLIVWGIVLLALSAVAVGAITFGASANATR